MGNPQFTMPWHGIPRDQIDWHPVINPDVCNGCGLCTTSCGRAVFRYDYDARKSVVVEPVQCMVGCTTCANTCTEQAISFQPISDLRLIIKRNKVLQRVKKVELLDRERFGLPAAAPAEQ
jgi:NAD-dependent dihydropyrimidine dehydrogenase PreA subunit